MRQDDATLMDIQRAAELALSFVEGLSEMDFEEDLRTQSAVLHQLLALGEVAKRVSLGLKDQNPSVPWRRMAGMHTTLIPHHSSVGL